MLPRQGRPTAIWLNVPPTLALNAISASSGQVGTYTQDLTQGVVDTLIHYLFRGLGWESSFQTSYGLGGISSVKTVTSTTGLTAFANRNITGIRTTKVIPCSCRIDLRTAQMVCGSGPGALHPANRQRF